MKNKSVLISIQPYWCFLIIAKEMGWNVKEEKTIEVRKNFPQDTEWNKKVIIYCSKDKKSFNRIPKDYQLLMERFLGKVIGEFICDNIDEYSANERGWYIFPQEETCLLCDEIAKYGNSKALYGWHISELKIYDEPKEISDFGDCDKPAFQPLKRPPQSWCYVESTFLGKKVKGRNWF